MNGKFYLFSIYSSLVVTFKFNWKKSIAKSASPKMFLNKTINEICLKSTARTNTRTQSGGDDGFSLSVVKIGAVTEKLYGI